jgi:hypothetical protein
MPAFLAFSEMSLSRRMSWTMSIMSPGFRKEWKYIMSPREPSVKAGQKMGISFFGKMVSATQTGRVPETHFVRPIINRIFMVDLFAQSPDYAARRPDNSFLVLLPQRRVKNWGNPVLKLAIVIVGDDKIAYSVHSFASQVRAVEIEVAQIGMPQAFDKILLDSARSSDDC